jgi:hypothetical protein
LTSLADGGAIWPGCSVPKAHPLTSDELKQKQNFLVIIIVVSTSRTMALKTQQKKGKKKFIIEEVAAQ